MKRVSIALTGAVLAAGVLSGCGGNAYCDAVKDGQDTLNSFGSSRTSKAFGQYADLLNGIAKVAPADAKQDWTAIADATSDVVRQTSKLGLKLEQIPTQQEFGSSAKAAKAKVAAFNSLRTELKLTDADFAAKSPLNKSFLTFSETVKTHGVKVVKNVKQECEIDLK